MPAISLTPVSELLPQITRVLGRIMPRLAALLPADAELHHIGATAIPGAVTKGDVDVLVRVSSGLFLPTVEALRPHFEVKQPVNWTSDFASFGDDTGHELPLGIQVVVRESENDFLLYLRDYFIFNQAALEAYNRLKLEHAGEGSAGYWAAKSAFLGNILRNRGPVAAPPAAMPQLAVAPRAIPCIFTLMFDVFPSSSTGRTSGTAAAHRPARRIAG